MAETATILAIGQLTPDGHWAGIRSLAAGRWEPIFGGPDGLPRASSRPADRQRMLLIAAAIAYFSEALAETSAGLEATQGDLADVMHWLADTEPDATRATHLREAIDAVDDGLPGDAVASRLTPLIADEQIDPVDLLIAEVMRAPRLR